MNDKRPPLTMTTIGAKLGFPGFAPVRWAFNFAAMTFAKNCAFGDRLLVLDLLQQSLAHQAWVRISVRWAGDTIPERCFFLRDNGTMVATKADRGAILGAGAQVENIILSIGPSRTTAYKIRNLHALDVVTATTPIRFRV